MEVYFYEVQLKSFIQQEFGEIELFLKGRGGGLMVFKKNIPLFPV